MCCSEFQQLKELQSALPALAQSEAEACKSLIDAFSAWFAANYQVQKEGLNGAFQVRNFLHNESFVCPKCFDVL